MIAKYCPQSTPTANSAHSELGRPDRDTADEEDELRGREANRRCLPSTSVFNRPVIESYICILVFPGDVPQSTAETTDTVSMAVIVSSKTSISSKQL